jgi:hypothetical protein
VSSKNHSYEKVLEFGYISGCGYIWCLMIG